MTTTLSTRYTQAPAAIQTLFYAKSITEIHIGCSSTTVYRILDGAQPLYLKIHPRSPHFSFAHEVYVALRDHQPTEDDFVFTHGDYCLPNILLQGECVSGFIDLDRAGISDRYNDLAIASRSIAYNLGPEYEQRFFLSYGVEHIDDEKIQYFRMMDELF